MQVQEWTEEDEDRLLSDRKNWQHEKIKKIKTDAQKRYDAQYENYQCTGSPSAERAMRKWEDLLDVCRMAEESLKNECVRCDLRWKNGKSITDKLKEREQLGEETMKISEAIDLILCVASR